VDTRLPDPPESLAGAPLAFYAELRRMLGVVRPARLDPDNASVQFERDGLELRLVHADHDAWGIWATVGEPDAIVGTGSAHEHFFAPDEGETEMRPWTTVIVDFIAEILRGEIEIETTFRGNTPIAVRHFNLDESGRRTPLGYTGFPVPARLMLWREKRTETERESFR
jgi:hypothetical protein